MEWSVGKGAPWGLVLVANTGRHWTPVFFCGCASKGQDSPKASPRALFKWKDFIEQLKQLLKWMLIERWRMPSMLSSMCQHVQGLTLICGYMWAFLGSQGTNSDSVSSKWFDTGTTCHIQAYSTDLPYAFRSKKAGSFCIGPPYPRRMSRTTFYVRWHRILKSVMLMGVPALQRKTAFVEQSWWPEFDMFGSMPSCSFPRHKSSSQSWRKRIVIQQSEFSL